METIQTFKAIIDSLGIDWVVVLLYICAGLIVKAYLPDVIKIPVIKVNVSQAWRVLIVGSVIVLIYTFIEYKYPTEFTRATLKKLFVSYIFTTSFYEIVLKDTVAKWIVAGLEKLKPSEG